MIRAISKYDSDFIYVYSIYECKDKNYYLASCSNNQGLIVYRESEISNIEVLKDNYISLKDFDISSGLNDKMHPVLFNFLKDDSETYEGIIEGQLEFWLEFQKKLGHRP